MSPSRPFDEALFIVGPTLKPFQAESTRGSPRGETEAGGPALLHHRHPKTRSCRWHFLGEKNAKSGKTHIYSPPPPAVQPHFLFPAWAGEDAEHPQPGLGAPQSSQSSQSNPAEGTSKPSLLPFLPNPPPPPAASGEEGGGRGGGGGGEGRVRGGFKGSLSPRPGLLPPPRRDVGVRTQVCAGTFVSPSPRR